MDEIIKINYKENGKIELEVEIYITELKKRLPLIKREIKEIEIFKYISLFNEKREEIVGIYSNYLSDSFKNNYLYADNMLFDFSQITKEGFLELKPIMDEIEANYIYDILQDFKKINKVKKNTNILYNGTIITPDDSDNIKLKDNSIYNINKILLKIHQYYNKISNIKNEKDYESTDIHIDTIDTLSELYKEAVNRLEELYEELPEEYTYIIAKGINIVDKGMRNYIDKKIIMQVIDSVENMGK